jgi:N-acetylglucosaminyldiphosphoundecaprenol N-acetyl-beta-D-mannosaminyltransferase
MVRLCELAALHSFTVYFLGGRPGAAEGAARQLADRFPGLRIAAIDCPPMGFMDDLDLDLATCNRIEQASPDLLFVALGAPMQEFWIHQHLHLPAKVMIGIGGSFELLSGLTKRAPVFIQNAGCEWLWRLAMEPKRLWRRYLTCNIFFIFLVLRQLFFGRVRAEILSENGEQL